MPVQEKTKIIDVNWEEVESTCLQLASQLKNLPIHTIVAVRRGGLVPAAIISYALKTPSVEIIDPMRPHTYKMRGITLFLDDICDTGETFREMQHYFPLPALFAAPWVKLAGASLCNYFAHTVPNNVWVVFPWARNDPVNR